MAAVAVIGPATIDRVVQGGAHEHKRGGVVTYAGLTFAELGLETRVITNVAAGDMDVLEPLRQRGVDLCAGESPATTRFVNYVDGDARRQELPAWAGPITAQQIERGLVGVEYAHLGPLHPHDLEPEAIAAIGDRCRVGLDLQGYVRAIEGERVERGVSATLAAALQRADFVKASSDELDLVLAHCGRSLEQLMGDYAIGEWIVTEGSRGGWVVERSGRRTDFASVPVDEVVDPTGAGDVFFAAYLVYRLHRGMAIADAGRRAAELAARQVEGDFIAGALLQL